MLRAARFGKKFANHGGTYAGPINHDPLAIARRTAWASFGEIR